GTEFSNIESWEIIDKFYSRIFGIYNICANRVGEEKLPNAYGDSVNSLADDRDEPGVHRFWGGSEIINPFGKTIAKAIKHEPDWISADIQRDLLRQKRILLPYLRNDDPYFTHRELTRILYGKKYTDTDQAAGPTSFLGQFQT
ncbi:MAG: nitrilase-related carbon-nitrogen hydrolase, partial [Desulfarculaceae bacterium]